MLAETGHIALILALVLALLQGVLPLYGASKRDGTLMRFADRAAILQAIFAIFSFGALMTLFAVSDFSVQLVTTNSHTDKPMLYKLSGTWGNHEGSMLMWCMILALFGAAMSLFGRSLPLSLRARALGIQGLVGAGFFSFLIFTSNPFERLALVPANGQGLNPLLQDPGLAFHPPFLYLGYVGFSIAFSLAVAALLEGKVDAVWARWIRPWVLIAWSFLTIGITLGSYWAYYELGWGGWWFWDPVENVSFMPWLAGTALLHSTLVVEKRNTFITWTLLLAIATFSLSLMGAFVVRSGILSSVHAFAVDPERGVYLLILLGLATGGALLTYALRAGAIQKGAGFDDISREGALVMNNLLLVVATVTVLLGTFYPLIMDALTGDKITVAEPYFNMTFTPIMSILILFMGLGPLLRWRSDKVGRLKWTALGMLATALLIAGAIALFGRITLGALGFVLAVWLAAGTLATLASKVRLGSVSFGDSLKLLTRQPAATFGFTLAHLGLAVMVAGITSMAVWSDDDTQRLQPGESMPVAGLVYTLESVENAVGPNFQAAVGTVSVARDGALIRRFQTERRFYPVEETATTEAALDIGLINTYYASIGDFSEGMGWQFHAYYHPLVSWIWLGALIMALGGFVSLADKRFRLARPLQIQRTASNAAAVPAE